MQADRDLKFQYLGLQTLADRYLVHVQGRKIELPQTFWMRVAMGLPMEESNKEDRAIEFYNLLSSFRLCFFYTYSISIPALIVLNYLLAS